MGLSSGCAPWGLPWILGGSIHARTLRSATSCCQRSEGCRPPHSASYSTHTPHTRRPSFSSGVSLPLNEPTTTFPPDRITAELQKIATAPQPHWEPQLRGDLLARTAGRILGASAGGVDCLREQAQLRHDVLVEAGADPAEVRRWVEIGRERAARSGPPLSGL